MIIREFNAFVKFLPLNNISLGLHLDLRGPHIAIHFPFGWALLGWMHHDPEDTFTWEDGCYGIGCKIKDETTLSESHTDTSQDQ